MKFQSGGKTMSRNSFFKPLDSIIYFNTIVFIGSGISAINAQSKIWTLFFFLASLNIAFIVSTIRLRVRYKNELLRKIEIEAEAENKIDESSKETVNRAKKDLLERRIEAEIFAKIEKAKVIRNAYIPRSDGYHTEIDLIVICKQGIFIIESKNITGTITGNWKEEMLFISHPGGTTYPLQNPINQNSKHFEHLKNILGLKSTIFRNIVVFGDSTMIKNYDDIPYYAAICKLETLVKSMAKLSNKLKTQLEEHLVDNTYEVLLPYVKKTDEKEKIHIDRLKNINSGKR